MNVSGLIAAELGSKERMGQRGEEGGGVEEEDGKRERKRERNRGKRRQEEEKNETETQNKCIC